MIDEAQNLSWEVLEQVRLLTNLETERKKLLQIILIGQPELRDLLDQKSLRQLSQRITARYHLQPLDRREISGYVRHRLKQSGCKKAARELEGGRKRGWARIAAWAAAVVLILAAPVAAYTFGFLPESVAREVRQVISTWMPRLHSEKVSFETPGEWFAQAAFAAELTPVVKPETAIAKPKVRSLSPASPSPRVLAALEALGPDGLDRAISALPAETRSRVFMLRELSRLWRVPNPVLYDCLGVAEFGLSCLSDVRDLDTLLLLNRPAVVELTSKDAETAYALVRWVANGEVVVSLGETDFRVSSDDFSAAWQGSSVIFWRSPPLTRVPVTEKSPAADILWLRRALNLEAANYGGETLAAVERAAFDGTLREALHRFQRRSGLEVGDMAGERELIVLNSRLSFEFHPTLVN